MRLPCSVGVLLFEVSNERGPGPVLVVDLIPSHRVFVVRDAPDELPRNRRDRQNHAGGGDVHLRILGLSEVALEVNHDGCAPL
eukprot:936281-Prorocentrum_lima.AAC.1